MRETWVQSVGWEDPLEKGKATHSSILAWRIPWTIQSMGSQRVRHNFHFHTPPFPFDNHKFVFDRERQISYDTIYMWNLKNDTNELTKQKWAHRPFKYFQIFVPFQPFLPLFLSVSHSP